MLSIGKFKIKILLIKSFSLFTVYGPTVPTIQFQGTKDTNYSSRVQRIPTTVPGYKEYQLQFQDARDTNYSSRVQGIPTTVPGNKIYQP